MMRPITGGKYFQTLRPDEGYNVIDGRHVVISNITPCSVADEAENIDGWKFDARDATNEETEEWKEKRRKFRDGRSVWEMLEDHTSDR